MSRAASLAAASILAALLASQAAHAQIDTIVNTLSTCEPGGGIGASIGNVGASNTPSDVGFRFTVPHEMGGTITDLTVCVSASDAPYEAPFALFTDAAGAPGLLIDTFEVTVLETRGLSSTLADLGASLRSGRSYWIVALRSAESGAWARTFPEDPGLRARLQADEIVWSVDDHAISQMRVRVLPEPASAAVAAIAVFTMAALRRVASSRRDR